MPVLSSGFALPRAICVLRVRTARWRSRYSIRAFPDFHFYLSLQIRGGPPTRLFRHARLRNAPVRHWTHQSHPISFESPPTTPNAYHRDAQSYRTLPNSDNGCRLYPSLNFRNIPEWKCTPGYWYLSPREQFDGQPERSWPSIISLSVVPCSRLSR